MLPVINESLRTLENMREEIAREDRFYDSSVIPSIG